jgi:hypothetical protein
MSPENPTGELVLPEPVTVDTLYTLVDAGLDDLAADAVSQLHREAMPKYPEAAAALDALVKEIAGPRCPVFGWQVDKNPAEYTAAMGAAVSRIKGVVMVKETLAELFPEVDSETRCLTLMRAMHAETPAAAVEWLTGLAGMKQWPAQWSTIWAPEWLHEMCWELWEIEHKRYEEEKAV